jgi:ribonuclease I
MPTANVVCELRNEWCDDVIHSPWLGRGTGLITGCCLKALGVSGEEALERVQKARNGTCYQTNQQHYLLNSFLPAAPADRQNA